LKLCIATTTPFWWLQRYWRMAVLIFSDRAGTGATDVTTGSEQFVH